MTLISTKIRERERDCVSAILGAVQVQGFPLKDSKQHKVYFC